MSTLTATLVSANISTRKRAFWGERLSRICAELHSQYGVPTLGNLRDPVWEIFYILLSARTTEVLYQSTYKTLRKRFPTLQALGGASREEVHECIERGGFGRRRADQVVEIANRLLADFGSTAANWFRRSDADECYEYLVSLPGVGPKSALCVMMCSLDYDVFPVDVNVQRILSRVGVIEKGHTSRQAQRELAGAVPDGISKPLHVGLVVHGRRVCTPIAPACPACGIRVLCRQGRRSLRKLAAAQQ